MKKGFIFVLFCISTKFAFSQAISKDTIKTAFAKNNLYFLRSTCTDSAYLNSWYYNRTAFTSNDLKKHKIPIKKEN